MAPVKARETLLSFNMQARVKTDPVLSSVMGWYQQYYIFYVKLRDLASKTEIVAMFIDDSASALADDAADVMTYHEGSTGGGMNFTKECLDKVVADWFTREDVAVATVGGLPMAEIVSQTWLDSAKVESTDPPVNELIGDQQTIPDRWSTFTDQFAQYERMRQYHLVDVTFEDYLADQGVDSPVKPDREQNRSELITHYSEFTYPSTVVDGDGTATSRAIWSFNEIFRKKKFFTEPGFIIGVTCMRPKLYMQFQESAGVQMMQTPYAWIPASIEDDPFMRILKFDGVGGGEDGPLGTRPNEDYYVDIGDLFTYGDQFHNIASPTAAQGFPNLPSINLDHWYPAESDVDALFTTTTINENEQDGSMVLNILGYIEDMT